MGRRVGAFRRSPKQSHPTDAVIDPHLRLVHQRVNVRISGAL